MPAKRKVIKKKVVTDVENVQPKAKKQKKSLDDDSSSENSKDNDLEKVEKLKETEEIDRISTDIEIPKETEKFNLEEIKDLKEFVFEHNSMHMSEDFFEFLEFCKSINSTDPKNALKSAGLQLVGIYDLLLSGLKTDYKLYYRYFYDPPEFQTILKCSNDEESLLHFGYFRDDPKEMPCFVGINDAKVDGKIIPKGENLFSAVSWYIESLLAKKDNQKKEKSTELKDLLKKLNDWATKKKFSLELKTTRIKEREKKTNCKTFHGVGICVPIERECGYREVPETLDSMKKMFTNFCLKDKDSSVKMKKNKAEDSIQELITLVQFANDETDYGMGLELGLNMFSFGNLELHKYIKNLLPICYHLLDRNYYSDIIKAHLSQRDLVNLN